MNLTKNRYSFETISSEESNSIQSEWSRIPYKLLLSRIDSNYTKKITAEKRKDLEDKYGKTFPMITTQQLDHLYWKVASEYQNKIQRLPVNGFAQTKFEMIFNSNFYKTLSASTKARGVYTYPNQGSPQKLVIGPYIPDLVISGLAPIKSDLLCIEIDGGVHDYKSGKDRIYYDHLKELGVEVWSIYNKDVGNIEFIKGILNDNKVRNISRHHNQIEGALNRIKAFTVAYHWGYKRIEREFELIFGEKLNLIEELRIFSNYSSCPRVFKKEWDSFQA